VVWVRQMIRLRIRHREKNNAQRNVRDPPALGCEIETLVDRNGDEGTAEQATRRRGRRKQAVDDGRGLTLMKVSIVQHRVSVPNR